MRVSRVYVESPLAAGERATLSGDAANHIARVLRLRVGDPLTLFDGRGGEYAARVAEPQGAKVIALVGSQIRADFAAFVEEHMTSGTALCED